MKRRDLLKVLVGFPFAGLMPSPEQSTLEWLVDYDVSRSAVRIITEKRGRIVTRNVSLTAFTIDDQRLLDIEAELWCQLGDTYDVNRFLMALFGASRSLPRSTVDWLG